jgi:hypothetical protein
VSHTRDSASFLRLFHAPTYTRFSFLFWILSFPTCVCMLRLALVDVATANVFPMSYICFFSLFLAKPVDSFTRVVSWRLLHSQKKEERHKKRKESRHRGKETLSAPSAADGETTAKIPASPSPSLFLLQHARTPLRTQETIDSAPFFFSSQSFGSSFCLRSFNCTELRLLLCLLFVCVFRVF